MADEPTKISSIFDRPEYKPYANQWNTRLTELNLRAAYYDGSIYRKLKQELYTLGPRISKNIRPMFLPFARAVDIDAGIIGGDWLFPPSEKEPKADAWSAARDTLFDMSRWDTKGVLYTHYGAMYGVSGIRIADIREEKVIELQPARPTCFMLVYEGEYSAVPSMAFWVEKKKVAGAEYEYAEVITESDIMTFKNGEPFVYEAGRLAVEKNEQGVIPIVESLHIDDGTELGECTYQKSILLLNEVNEMAADLSQAIKDNVKPQWVTSGAEPTDLKRGSNIMWFLPEGGEVTPITPQVDISGVLEFIKEIKEGVKESLPELSYDELKKAGEIATATIELQLGELVIKIKRVRPNYDRGLVTAMQIAGETAKGMGLTDITPLADPELILDPKRPILPIMPSDQIALRMQEIELENMEKGRDQGEGIEDDENGED